MDTTELSAEAEAAVATSAPNQYVTFSCGDRTLGVDIMSVREIRSWSPLTELPDLPRGARGVLDIRGKIVTVYDLSSLIGTPFVEGAPVIVVVSHGGHDIGIMVSAVSDIIFAQTEQLREAPTSDRGDAAVTRLVKQEDHLVSILNLNALFPNANPHYLN
jgi:purine-binding chemotaxis protein CheW